MSRLERLILRTLLVRAIFAEPDHFKGTRFVYEEVRGIWRRTFSEDNAPTISHSLSECFEATQVWPFGRPKEHSNG